MDVESSGSGSSGSSSSGSSSSSRGLSDNRTTHSRVNGGAFGGLGQCRLGHARPSCCAKNHACDVDLECRPFLPLCKNHARPSCCTKNHACDL